MRDVVIYMLILWAGIVVGFLLHYWLGYRSSYTGTIHITEKDHKTLYSLELEDYPDELRFKKEVVFKVDASNLKPFDQSLDRE